MIRARILFFILFSIPFMVSAQSFNFKKTISEATSKAKSDPEKAIELTHSAFDYAKEKRNTYQMVIAKSAMGYIGMKTRDYAASYINYSDALEYLDKCDTVDLYNKMDILRNLAVIKSRYSDFQGSIRLYDLAHKTAIQYINKHPEIAKKYNDTKLLVDIPFYMAMQLKNNGQYEESGKILVDLWEKSEYRKDTATLANVLTQLGVIKMHNKDYLKAQEFFGLVAFSEEVKPKSRAIALHNLASSYKEQLDYEKALSYYGQALELKREFSNKRSQFITMLDQGEVMFIQGKMDEAIGTWEAALLEFDKIETEPELFVVYDFLQKAYVDIDTEKAVNYSSIYSNSVRDWMNIQNNRVDNPELQAFNSRLDVILASRTVQAQRITMVKRYWPFGVIALLIIAFLGYQFTLFLNKQREVFATKKLKAQRADRAEEIFRQIRREDF